MEDLKIIGWTYFDSPYKTRKYDREGIHKVMSLIYDCIEQNRYFFSGEEHQTASTGMPVFSDGTCFRASMRCWANLMANVYSGDGQEYSYMDFYMSLGDASRMPEYTPIDVPPAELEEETIGATVKADREIIDQSIEMDMEFMTNDKVLKKLFEKLKAEKTRTE